jgi:superfamily II DNA/RNA helicase
LRSQSGAQADIERTYAISLHGNLSQNQRDKAMHLFRHGHARILVATDIAARGIDVTGITHVINYDLPMDPNTYSHRLGRTARAGAEGKGITLVTPE